MLMVGLSSFSWWSPTAIFYLGGIQINEASQADFATQLKVAKMNTVEVTIYAQQGAWDSDDLAIPLVDSVALYRIQSAKQAGLHVALLLRVQLDNALPENKFLWHGMILPTGNEKLQNWFRKYEKFVTTWAAIAEEEGVEILGVGSELNALVATCPINKIPHRYAYFNNKPLQKQWENRSFKYEKELQQEDMKVHGQASYADLDNYVDDRIEAHYNWGKFATFRGKWNRVGRMNKRRRTIKKHWKQLIAQTRKVYKGKLTYAANFDNYMDVDFWEELDLMGINAYFPLRNLSKNPLTEADMQTSLEAGWQRAFRQINQFRAKEKLEEMPLLFTELGYLYRDNCTITPWEGFGFSVIGNGNKQELLVWSKQPINYTERRLAIDALYEVVRAEQINLQGILYWKLTTHPEQLVYEPFGLVLTKDGADPMQKSLARFRNLEQ